MGFVIPVTELDQLLIIFCFQAAKPKHSVSEKENNPVKSAEALPDVKKMEYRLLRDDMARCCSHVFLHTFRSF